MSCQLYSGCYRGIQECENILFLLGMYFCYFSLLLLTRVHGSIQALCM
uniref:Uncharacterized protein n=1 Tax=Anguilla anguilla TaxID=7936 RepID=A0A0E9R1I1_ANGAN